jgi:Skp family chaperone for outer membrane proteins
VKRSPFLVVLTAITMLGLLAGVAVPQAPGAGPPAAAPAVRTAAPRPAGSIVLLDISYIFENLPRFKQMMNEMKTDVDSAEQGVKKDRDAIKQLADRLEGYKGTADYKALEEEIAKRNADLAVRIQLQKKEFLQREARIYHNVYKEITQEVDYYCQQNNIDVVLRFNGDPVDVDRPDSVLAFINRPVVSYAKDRDVTPIILDRLVKRSPAATTANPAMPGQPLQNRPAASMPFNR